ncbi:hypothetical protein ABZ540_35215 [Nocardia xishanensis]|uniref:hypothetical protein n=1 Tax=Nocardia xishanensis TaxID=238964 RepID=UPI00340DC6A5
MMTDPLHPVDPLRLRHIHGEALLGRDLSDQSAQDQQLRWWHNRALHRAYGIVSGLEVMPPEDGVATVAPGLAYDRRGRELRLDQCRTVEVPPSAELHLMLMWHPSEPGEVTLSWLPRDAAAHSDGVRLAVDDAENPAAQVRPLARPRIGRGATIPGATAWRPWTEEIHGDEWYLGFQVEVDTSAAGFTDVPCYFTQITGSIQITASTSDPTATHAVQLFVPSFDHIARTSKDGVTVRLLMPWLNFFRLLAPPNLFDLVEELRSLASTTVAVTWIGIEQRSEGHP